MPLNYSTSFGIHNLSISDVKNDRMNTADVSDR